MSESIILSASLLFGILIIVRYGVPTLNVALNNRKNAVIKEKKDLECYIHSLNNDLIKVKDDFNETKKLCKNWLSFAKDELSRREKKINDDFLLKLDLLKKEAVKMQELTVINRNNLKVSNIILALKNKVKEENPFSIDLLKESFEETCEA